VSFLKVENLGIRFGGVVAVDNVSFEVRRGEVFTIIGPNGAGKTTIFNLLGLIYAPSSGRMLFEGRDLTGFSPHRIAAIGIARTFQNIELFEHASVLQNLLIGRHRHRSTSLWQELTFTPAVRRAEIAHREAVEKVIDFLDLAKVRDTLVAGLPYGVRKVVELGRALATEPRLLLLDEPSSGLDRDETRALTETLRAVHQQHGTAMLLVEHDIDMVLDLVERIYVLDFGTLIAEGSADKVLQNDRVREAYLGEMSITGESS
jgi:branched-chain amino acid transport system ATP-binding protein